MILYIDSTEKNFELRLYNTAGGLVDKFFSESVANHSEELIRSIQSLLTKNNCGKASLSKLAVVTGPGSYTGLRVGVATANAMAFASNLPVFGILKGNEKELKAVFKSNLSRFDSAVRVHYEKPPHITIPKK